MPATGAPWVVVALLVSLFGLLGLRLGQLQLVQGPDRPGSARDVHTRVIVDPALRGQILDRSGRPLVTNTFTTTVTIERGVLLDRDDEGRALITSIATALGRPVEELWGKTKLCGTSGAPPAPACFNGSPVVPIPIATQVDPRAALSLVEQPERFPGVGVQPEAVRSYPSPERVNAAHLLGHVAPANADEVTSGRFAPEDLIGRAGLEASYDTALRGLNGSTTVSVDPRGVVTGTLSSVATVPGKDVVTHIDARLQSRVEGILAATVADARGQKFPADSASAVVIDVTNGGIVAAASYPTYDPAAFVGGISRTELNRLGSPAAGTPLANRILTETFPPASTFKVISVPAAVRAGADLTGRYDCSPNLTVGGQVFNNYESRGYGMIDLHKTLVVSCDTVFYRFAYANWVRQGGLSAPVGTVDPFVQTAREFGLGARTGVDLPSESSGRVADRQWKLDHWEATRADTCQRAATGYPEIAKTDRARADYLGRLAKENCTSGYQYRAGDAVNFSIGQGDTSVTVLQMARVYAAIANGGTLWQPHVASGLRADDGSVTPIAPVASGRIPVSPEVLSYLQAALGDVTKPGGSAGSAFTGFPQDSYPVAGKTGTGEVFGKTAVAWFAAYGPTTKPKYAVVVLVSQGDSGSKVAAPAARQIFDAIRDLKL